MEMSEEAARSIQRPDEMPLGELTLEKITTDTVVENVLPPKPQEPLPTDCCGSGCTPCVYDLYDQELALWTAECERIRRGETADSKEAGEEVLSPDCYQQFELIQIEQVNPDSFLYTFRIPGGQSLPMSVGQHLVLRCQGEDKTVTRQYTPVSVPSTKGKMEFIIKLYSDGEMSKYISSWQVGHMVDWRGPFGNFVYRRNMYKRLIMFAAGTGITPMAQLIQTVLADENDDTQLHLVYCCPHRGALLCKDLIDDWVCFWNFSVTYFFSQDSDRRNLAHRTPEKDTVWGRLCEDHVKGISEITSPGIFCLICGTKSFDKDVINYLSRLGKTPHDYHKF